MVMRLLNRKGFLLIDSLICVMITSLLCVSCYSIYKAIDNYENAYIEYQTRSNNDLEDIYNSLKECETCELDESD